MRGAEDDLNTCGLCKWKDLLPAKMGVTAGVGVEIGRTMFQRCIFYPSGAGEKPIGYSSLEFKKWSASTVNLRVISM